MNKGDLVSAVTKEALFSIRENVFYQGVQNENRSVTHQI